MFSKIFAILFVLLLTGCATKSKSQIVLLPEDDGKVGVVNVKGRYSTVKLTKAYEYISSTEGETDKVALLEENSFKEKFKEAFESLPKKPEAYTLYFEFDSVKLTDSSKKLLERIVILIKKRKTDDIYVTGHSDLAGSKGINYKISKKRAELVANYLSLNGIQKSYMKVASYGDTFPVVKTAKGVAESRNRRVEINIR